MQSIILSIVIGIVSGFIYGLSFFESRMRALSSYQDSNIQNFYFKNSLLSIIRILSLIFIFYYLLPLESINSILVLLFFVLTFWLFILKKEKII